MPKTGEILHRYIQNAALPYDALGSPIGREPSFSAGSNILTSINNCAERRPGFPLSIEPDNVTTFSAVKRIFGWKKWGGAYYIMVNDVTSTQSNVYSLKVGTDTTFVSQFNSASTEPFDFVASNNTLFMANGTDMQKFDGTTVSRWGIAAPATAPTTVLLGGGTLSATAGYRYVFCFYNSTTGHLSSPSPITIPGDPANAVFAAQTVRITGTGSADPQVDQVRIFRTTDGGSGVYFEVTGSPIAEVPVWTLDDSTTDANLSSIQAPSNNINDDWSSAGRSAGKGLVLFASRLWYFAGGSVYATAFEESLIGVPEESFPPTMQWTFGEEVTGLAVANEGLLNYTGSTISKISGDSLDTFRRDPLFGRLGTRNRACLASVGKSVAWLDTGNTVRITDGYSQTEFSETIRPDISSIAHSQSALCYHNDGQRQWLILMDGAAGKLRVFDADEKAQRWMPPWSAAGVGIGSVETADGRFKLVLGSTKPFAMNYNTWNDNGGAYSATATTNLVSLTASETPGHTAVSEYFVLERNQGTAPTDVLQATDEDPAAPGTFVSIFANRVDPDFRTQGTTLIEDWYKSRQPSARRVAMRVDWPAVDQNFKLYAIDFASSEQPGK